MQVGVIKEHVEEVKGWFGLRYRHLILCNVNNFLYCRLSTHMISLSICPSTNAARMRHLEHARLGREEVVHYTLVSMLSMVRDTIDNCQYLPCKTSCSTFLKLRMTSLCIPKRKVKVLNQYCLDHDLWI